jgi:hypothetical protein
MATRSERYQYEQGASKSRVARNQELYEQIYASDSYFQNDDKPSGIERTNEIDIEKVKELLKGREIYRREMKMREINMGAPEVEEEAVQEETSEEKDYDINAYLNKASSERETEPYHKIDPEIMVQTEEVEEEEPPEPTADELKEMGTTALSLELFGDLDSTSEQEEVDEEEEEPEELVATITQTNAFFTDSIKLDLDDEEDDEDDEKTSPAIKIVMVLLILIIIGLVVFLILM